VKLWALLCLLFFVVPARAANEELKDFEGKVLLGAELELTPGLLNRIIHYFDFSVFERGNDLLVPGYTTKSDMPRAWLEDYLWDPANLESLSSETQRELTQGLSVQERPAEHRRASDEWEIVEKRWAKMCYAHAEEVSLNRMPAHVKSALAIRIRDLNMIGSLAIDPLNPLIPELRLRADAPKAVQKALEGFESHKDGKVLEFVHGKPLASPTHYLESVEGLARAVESWDALQKPGHAGGAAYHVHISFKDGRDLSRRAELMNLEMALRYLDKGAERFLFDRESTVRLNDVGYKGLLRLIAKNRIELRAHLDDPKTELLDRLRLFGMEEEVALKELRSRVLQRLDTAKLDLLAKHEPWILADAWEHLETEFIDRPELRKALLERMSLCLQNPLDSLEPTKLLSRLAHKRVGERELALQLSELLGRRESTMNYQVLRALDSIGISDELVIERIKSFSNQTGIHEQLKATADVTLSSLRRRPQLQKAEVVMNIPAGCLARIRRWAGL
jgi:hypothetical protein